MIQHLVVHLKLFGKKSDCHIYFIKQKLAFKIAFHLNLKNFSNGHHFAVESFQNKNVSEVLKLFNKWKYIIRNCFFHKIFHNSDVKIENSPFIINQTLEPILRILTWNKVWYLWGWKILAKKRAFNCKQNSNSRHFTVVERRTF